MSTENELETNINAGKVSASKGIGILSVTTDLLLAFAKGFATSVGGKVGTSLLGSIFGTNQLDTAALCDALSTLLDEANTRQTVNEQSGLISSVQTDATIDYTNLKEAHPNDKEQLQKNIVVLLNKIKNPLAILRQVQFQYNGISVYIVGANVHLALCQEGAEVDPTTTTPTQSHFYADYRDWLDQHIQHVKKMRKEITDKRIGQVSEVTAEYVSNGGGPYGFYSCKYKDSFTGKTYEYTEKDKSRGVRLATESRDALIKALKAELNWIDDEVREWEKALAI